jgi:RNA polymerase sigma-32 factor
LLDVLPSQELGVDEEIAKRELRDIVREKLAHFITTLSEREEDIFRNRLLSETPITLEDLGRKYGITKERTRQLEARLIKRFRDYLRKEIQDFDRLRS